MTETTPRSPQTRRRSGGAAAGLTLAGLVLAAGAFLLPVNVTSVSPALLAAAGRGTPKPAAYGRDLVELEKIGPAAMVLAAAQAAGDPQAPELAAALAQYAERQPALMAWGGWDPFLDPLFGLRKDTGRKESTPVLSFLLPAEARGRLRGELERSGSLGVQTLLKLRMLEKAGRFVPATRAGGQPLDATILLASLLYQGGHLSTPLQREVRGLAETAIIRNELGELAVFFADLLSLGRRLDWAQLAELVRRTDGTKAVGEFAHLARVAPDRLPTIYAAALFSDSADRVASYLIEYGRNGLEDLGLALGHGQGAVRQLLARKVPVNRTGNAVMTAGAELALRYPQALLVAKYLGFLAGVWLVLRGLDRLLDRTGGGAALPASLGRIKAGVLAVVFALLLVAGSEPFLLRAAPLSEFQLRLPALVSVVEAPATATTEPAKIMDASTLLSIGLFAALQVAMYFICLLKIREVARQPVPAAVKLRLMENEENLFDGGLYVGIGGTAAALVMQVLGVIEANLLAAYSSNLFGIVCVAMVKIRHVRPYKQRLILEGQVGVAAPGGADDLAATPAGGSAAR